jgi:pyruvate,water dikinase
MLPGFQVNRTFMEQMMGVREPLPEHIVAELASDRRGARIWDAFNLAWSVTGLIHNYWMLPRNMRRFTQRFEDALATGAADLSDWPADRLTGHFYELERRLLTRWDAPLVNDFFAMIFYGLLGKLCEKWLGSKELQNDLVVDSGPMVSAEPARRVREMGALAAKSPELAELLRTGSLEDIRRVLPQNAPLRDAYDAYLVKFGDRCLEELKLESPTLHDDPLTLLRAVGQVAGQAAVNATPAEDSRSDKAIAEAEARLKGHWVRLALFRWVLRNARDRVRDRENLRFERTRLFGRVRRIFVELGRRFREAGCLDDARDVFYLEQEEIFGFVGGTCTTASLRELVATRRHEFEGYRAGPPPPDRFETRGVVYTCPVSAAAALGGDDAGEERRGLGCCAGRVRGKVRVVRDPRNHGLRSGEILVAERTDPGWILLFPLAAGLLVERGSLLSHSAIVSREMGIPAVVSVPGITSWLNDGDEVEFDGATGVVRRLGSEEGAKVEE